MSYCHGSHSPYGCSHHREHQEAARKGWLHRRRHEGDLSERERRWLQRVTGPVEHVHTDASHRGRYLFRQKGKWYELPKTEVRRLISAGKADELDEARERKQQERERAREAAAIARFRKAEAEDARREARERERREKQLRRDRERQARHFERIQRAEYNDVIRTIRDAGGIKRSVSRNTGREYDRGEYNSLPASVRARKGQGLTLDYAREAVAESYPWLDVDTTDDLLRFFDKEHTRRMNRVRRAA